MSNSLRRRRLLRPRRARRLPQLRAGVVARAPARPSRPAATTRATAGDQAAVHLRHRRQVRRRGRLPAVPDRDRLRRRALREQQVHAAVDLQRDRDLRRARRDLLRSVRLQRQPVLRQLRDRRELLARQRLRRRTRAARNRTAPSAPTGAECLSGNCAQGVCCATACMGACRSCALSGTMGICTNVPTGAPDPSQTCVDHGRRDLRHQRQVRGRRLPEIRVGTPCGPASCPAGATTLTPSPTCDGAGTCITPAATSCFPFRCGAAACKSTCSADADCAPPACAPAARAACARTARAAPAPAPNASAACARRASAARPPAAASCVSCALAGTEGTCTPMPAGGVDPKGQCTTRAPSTCGMTGFCDGKGGCQRYPAGTQCAPPSCPTSVLRPRRSPAPATAAGTCRPATTLSCGVIHVQRHDLQRRVRRGRGLLGGQRLQWRAPAATSGSASCARRGGMRQRQLCRGRLLLVTACGNCQSCNVRAWRAVYPVPAGDDGAAQRLQPQPALRANGTCDGNGACRYASRAAELRHRDVQRLDVDTASASATARAPASRGPRAARPMPARGACGTTCGATATARAGSAAFGVCTDLKATAPRARRDRVLQRPTAPTGSAARPTARRLPRVRRRGLPRDLRRPYRRAATDPPSAVRRHPPPRPAARTGSASRGRPVRLLPGRHDLCGPNTCVADNMMSRTTVCSGTGSLLRRRRSPIARPTLRPATGNCRTSCADPVGLPERKQLRGRLLPARLVAPARQATFAGGIDAQPGARQYRSGDQAPQRPFGSQVWATSWPWFRAREAC